MDISNTLALVGLGTTIAGFAHGARWRFQAEKNERELWDLRMGVQPTGLVPAATAPEVVQVDVPKGSDGGMDNLLLDLIASPYRGGFPDQRTPGDAS